MKVKCKRCKGYGYVVVEEYLMTTAACPACNKKEKDKPHPGNALIYSRV